MSKINSIIRTSVRAEGGLTEEESLAMKAHTDLWIRRAMRTDPIEPEKIIPAIERLYEVSGLKKPRVVIVPSPLVMAFSGGAAAWIWYCQKNDAATDAATRSATDAATRSATDAATYAATYAATDAATRSATDAATYAATDAATYAAKIACYEIAGEGGVKCAGRWGGPYQGGNMWAGSVAHLTSFRDVLKLELPVYEKYQAWEDCAIHGGFRWMHDEFCIVSDFPEFIKIDDRNRPHCDDGPSHRWRDGWELYHIHGVRVNRQIVMFPNTITVEQIDTETNAEIRRIMIDRYGLSRYIKDSGAEVVDERGDQESIKGLKTAKLLVKKQEGDESIVMLDMLNSTAEPDGSIKRYLIRIDPNAYGGLASENCLAAMASTYRQPDGSLVFEKPQDYLPLAES